MRIQLPSNSSDLNPLENLWVVIKKIVYIVTEILVRDCRTLVSSSETVGEGKVTGAGPTLTHLGLPPTTTVTTAGRTIGLAPPQVIAHQAGVATEARLKQ